MIVNKLVKILLVIVFNVSIASAQEDSLFRLWKDLSLSDSIRIKALQEFTFKKHLFSNADSANYYIELQLKFATDRGFDIALPMAYSQMGILNAIQGNYEEAQNAYHKALGLHEKNNNDIGKADIYHNLAILAKDQGNYVQSIQYNQSCLRIREKMGDSVGIANSLNNIGSIYNIQKDNEQSLAYYNRSLAIKLNVGQPRPIAVTQANIGVVFQEDKNYDEALTYFEKSFQNFEKAGDKKGMIGVQMSIAEIKMTLRDFDQSEEILFGLIADLKELRDVLFSVKVYRNLAELEYKRSNYKKAIEYAEEVLPKAIDAKLVVEIKGLYEVLNNAYAATGNYKEAYGFHQLFIQTRDSILSEENRKEIMRQEFQYEFDKQAALAQEKYESELAIEREEKKRQRILLLFFIAGFVFILIVAYALYRSVKLKNKANRIISQQKKEAEFQRNLVEEKNKEILDSITYAKRLQDAILPSPKVLNENLKNGFILYKPKDVVSGDFYFMDVVEENSNKLVYYVAADCTGHGVPGAMVSIVGANGLKRCIQEFKLRAPGEILDKLAQLVAENFSQSEEKIRDGMDLALCCLEIENDQTIKVHYAGANNPLWVINPNRKTVPESAIPFKEGGGFEIKANKQAIGYTENISPFTTHTFEVEAGDTLYTFSDGYPDQFGGEQGKKYKSANFRKFLLSIQDKNMDEQKQLVNEEFENWKGDLEQIDDVCVIGVRL